jgi:heat shock transcription factor
LSSLRKQQKLILRAINHLQRNTNELNHRALMFRNQHDRHEKSIHAIANFLGIIFHKTLGEQGDLQDVSHVSSSLTINSGHQQPPQGKLADAEGLNKNQFDLKPNTAIDEIFKLAQDLSPLAVGQSRETSPNRALSSLPHPSYDGINNRNLEMGRAHESFDIPPLLTRPDLQEF